jgi:lipid-A-disaccharide synthase-like uncharacterized protein
MKRRYKILIAAASLIALAAAVHFGGRFVVDWIVQLHS